MKRLLLILLSLSIMVVGCSNNENTERSYNDYVGRRLTIAVVGECPKDVSFLITYKKIDLPDLLNDDLNSYDAIFIMPDYLSEAAESEYADIYRNSHKPYFFIGTTKAFIPFVEPELSYEDAIEVTDGSYITGVAYTEDDSIYFWSFSYDGKIEDRIDEVYINLYNTIDRYFREISPKKISCNKQCLL